MRKSKRTLIHAYKLFKRKKKNLTQSACTQIKCALEELQTAILQKRHELLKEKAERVEHLCKLHMPKTSFDRLRNSIESMLFALALAIVVRQMWFELYEIPTGSMRPTFKEKDRLVVSKDQFCLNIPLTKKHFHFDPNLVQRGGTIVFTGQDMDIQDVDTTYFYLFPGKKQYVKRLLGKPGDTLYFYGGRIYGLDKDLNDISKELQPATLDKIDHVPYIYIEGKDVVSNSSKYGIYDSVTLYQMNMPVAKLTSAKGKSVSGELLGVAKEAGDYDNLWGFKNYAVARLLTKAEYFSEVLNSSSLESLPAADYYLELTHDPSLSNASLKTDVYGRMRPSIGTQVSYIPLSQSHLRTLFDNLYTARFTVDEKGDVKLYGYKKRNKVPELYRSRLKDIPAGTYEFYYGKAYQIKWQGLAKELPPSHPIYKFSPEKLLTLFNQGLRFDKRLSFVPSRFAFFREGSLYVMGSSFLKSEDPLLAEFVKNERIKALSPSSKAPYLPFIDHKAPTKEDILRYGVKIPEGHYLALGDNYAMSADSRDFGFVPESNLRGVPDFIFWPHVGLPNQPHYILFTLPRMIVWILAGSIICCWILIQNRRYRLPLELN